MGAKLRDPLKLPKYHRQYGTEEGFKEGPELGAHYVKICESRVRSIQIPFNLIERKRKMCESFCGVYLVL